MIIGGRKHLFTEGRGCICGSCVVATTPDARELRNLLDQWSKLHPQGRYLEGVPHGACSVDEARARRKAKGVEAERSRLELR